MQDTSAPRRIAAVVVTYNRRALLKECIDALITQTRPLDEIFVIDNASADGTGEMLAAAFAGKITYIRLSENLGGAGGSHKGISLAYESGYDWIWIMDDDALPAKDCLENLLAAVQEIDGGPFCLYACHLDPSGQFFSEPITVITQRGAGVRIERYQEAVEMGRILEATGTPLLGVLVPSRIVDLVGFPRPDTYIWGDYEYFFRVRDGGFKVYYDTKSILYHPKHDFVTLRFSIPLLRAGKPLRVVLQCPPGPLWKHYYGIRNSVYFSLRSGKLLFPRLLKAVIYVAFYCLVTVGRSPDKFRAVRFCLQAIVDGLLGRMGKRVMPS